MKYLLRFRIHLFNSLFTADLHLVLLQLVYID